VFQLAVLYKEKKQTKRELLAWIGRSNLEEVSGENETPRWRHALFSILFDGVNGMWRK